VRRFVLVIEDDEDVRETFEMILTGAGYEVLTAANGAEGLEVLRTRGDEIALILLDIVMPTMDGWQFLEERSKSEALERVPTIVLSGAHPTNPISSHATAFLMKPIGAKDLMTAVHAYSAV
jgi:CheY-like chemotaxis protein